MKTHYLVGAITFSLTCFTLPTQARPIRQSNAQQPAVLTVTPEQSQGLTGAALTVEVWSGRATVIDFSRVQERITQIFLADPSRFTYATDTPLDKGEATALFLRLILPLKFPNLTTARVTNLFVKTRTRTGTTRLYTFNVKSGESYQQNYNGITLSNFTPLQSGKSPTLQVGSSRPATLDDIERGLLLALHRNYTLPSDPIVSKVREFLALARNTSDKSLIEISQELKIPLAVLTQLGRLGIEDVFKNPASAPTSTPTLTPTPATPLPEFKSMSQEVMVNE